MVVYNATRVNKLAAGYADRLEKAGFTNVTAENWNGYGLSSSAVLYNQSSFKGTAEAVAKELGIPAYQTPNLKLNGVAAVMFK
ncbi:LytR family transcriptional regulator [Micrococcus lylae]|uniref:LytR family transcriptional regulator n=1 Tax=Micrococcus lylae TaxID=1273 RepID=A0ABY2JZ41_9MICC|nr:LytR family transcriptional regulator [Micrococcus lylae]